MIKLPRRIDEPLCVFAEGNDLAALSPTFERRGRDTDLLRDAVSSQEFGCCPVCRVIIDGDFVQQRFTLFQADQSPEAGSLMEVYAVPGSAERSVQRPRAVFPFPRSLMVKTGKIVGKEGRNVVRGRLC